MKEDLEGKPESYLGPLAFMETRAQAKATTGFRLFSFVSELPA